MVGFIPDSILVDGKFFEFYTRTIKNNLSRYAPATAQKNINLKILNQVVVPLPSLAEQRVIVACVEKLFHFAYEVEQRYQQAQAHVDKLTQSILGKAFRGELVSQDPNDEPASVVLEQIKQERAKIGKEKKARNRKETRTLLDYC